MPYEHEMPWCHRLRSTSNPFCGPSSCLCYHAFDTTNTSYHVLKEHRVLPQELQLDSEDVDTHFVRLTFLDFNPFTYYCCVTKVDHLKCSLCRLLLSHRSRQSCVVLNRLSNHSACLLGTRNIPLWIHCRISLIAVSSKIWHLKILPYEL